MGARELTFDEATHTYRHAGAVVPGVTQLLAPLVNFDSLSDVVVLVPMARPK